jgi:phosphoenolpyruvate carboxylase
MMGQTYIENYDTEIQELKNKYSVLMKKKDYLFRILSAQNRSQRDYNHIKTYRNKLHEINQEIKKTEKDLERLNGGSYDPYIDHVKRKKEKFHSRLDIQDFEGNKTSLIFDFDPKEMRANFIETLNLSKKKRFAFSDVSIQLIDELKEKIQKPD